MTWVPFPKPTADDRAWLARWAESLVHPVADLVPEGSGRVCLAVRGADYEAEAAEMEAFVRPLWGLAPLISGGFAQSCSVIFCAGIAAGTDPQNPEFWGDVRPSDQRMVEMAGIAFAWLLAPGLTVSRDGLIWLRRGRITDSGLRDGLAWGRWSPFSGLEIESWSAFAGPGWHVRLHRITTDMDLHIAESGFAVNRAQDLDEQGSNAHAVFLSGQEHVTGILDLGDNRWACTLVAAPNTHLLFPRTRIPRLVGIAKAGTSIVTTAVLGCAVGTVTPVRPLLPMAFLELEQRLKSRFTQ